MSLYKEWQFSCHHTAGRNVKDLSLETVLPQIVYCPKISVSLYKEWQFSCHHTAGRNVKDLSLETVLLHKNKCKFIP